MPAREARLTFCKFNVPPQMRGVIMSFPEPNELYLRAPKEGCKPFLLETLPYSSPSSSEHSLCHKSCSHAPHRTAWYLRRPSLPFRFPWTPGIFPLGGSHFSPFRVLSSSLLFNSRAQDAELSQKTAHSRDSTAQHESSLIPHCYYNEKPDCCIGTAVAYPPNLYELYVPRAQNGYRSAKPGIAQSRDDLSLFLRVRVRISPSSHSNTMSRRI